jgi:hypothetical protein
MTEMGKTFNVQKRPRVYSALLIKKEKNTEKECTFVKEFFLQTYGNMVDRQ